MKVLLTGACGFIGGYVADELKKNGHYVIGLDNLSRTIKGKKTTLDELHVGDAKNADVVEDLLRDCDHFVACAGAVGGIEYFHRNQFSLLAENNALSGAAAEAAICARRSGSPLQKVTWISSSMVYERTVMFPSREGDELVCWPPASSYGFSKLAVEYYARAAWEQFGLPYTILRPFNCVGVGEYPDTPHVVPELCRKVLGNPDGPVPILGNGGQIRHYTYGGDLAEGIVTSLTHDGALNEDFNLASDESTTVLQLLQLIHRKVRGDDSELTWVSDTPFRYDVKKRIPSTRKARDVLGWSARTTLEEMVSEVIESVRGELTATGGM